MIEILGPGWGITWGRAFSWSAIAQAFESAPPAANNSGATDDLISLFSAIRYSPDNMESLRQLGQKVHSHLNGPDSDSIRQSEAGKKLAVLQVKLANFLQLEKSLSNCEAAKEDNMYSRLMAVAGNAEVSDQANCDALRNADVMRLTQGLRSDLAEVLEQVNPTRNPQEKANRHGDLAMLSNELYRQSLKNSTETYVTLKHRYRRGGGGNAVDSKWIYPLLSGARPEVAKEMNAHADLVGRNLQSKNIPSTDFNAATKEINSRVDTLNESLSKVPFSVKKGWLWNAAETNDETTKAFQKYSSQYMAVASAGDGQLLLTDTLREKVGGLHQQDDVKKGWYSFNFEPHKKVTAEDVAAAEEEAERKIIEQSLALTKTMSAGGSEAKLAENLEKFVMTNPAAVGQVLLSHPEMAQYICDAIGQASLHRREKEASDKTWGKVFLWGGVIVGGVLIATGVGAAAGAWVLGSTAFAATTTATVLATTATVAGTTGTILGLAGATHEGMQAYDAKQEYNEVQAAILSGNADPQQIEEASKAYHQFEDKRMSAAVQLGFSALDLGAMSAALKLTGKGVDVVAKTKAMKTASKALEDLAKDSKLINGLGSNLKSASAATRNSFSKLLGYASQVSEKVRVALLQKLQGKGPAAFQELVQKALIAAEKGCAGG